MSKNEFRFARKMEKKECKRGGQREIGFNLLVYLHLIKKFVLLHLLFSILTTDIHVTYVIFIPFTK